MIINALDLFDDLEVRTPKACKTAGIISFMNTLDKAYFAETGASGMRGKNGVTWLQYFLNGDWLENELKKLNPRLKYIEAGHGLINNETSGNNIPDFEFTYNDKKQTIDSKTFSTLDNFNSSSKFEGADFCIAFIMSESKFYFRKKINGAYLNAIDMDDITEHYPMLMPYIGWIKLPAIVKMIKFGVDKNTLDRDVPETVNYEVIEYTVKNDDGLDIDRFCDCGRKLTTAGECPVCDLGEDQDDYPVD